MTWDSIEKIVSKVKSGKVSATELVNKSFDEIDKHKDLNAIITIARESALDRAKEIDQKIASGEEAGRLAGVPFIAKDNFLTKDVKTTAASKILGDFIPPYSATAITKLEDEGAILVAKANLDSFAHGSSTENSDYGVTLNPHDKSRVPGGSSGGSGAAVAAGLAPFALGTDTGGSIRLPASFCGVVGLKPTYGLVSRYGVVAMASSTDVIGPLANSVDDAALVLDVMAGKDENDSTTINRASKDYSNSQSKKLKVGLISEFSGDGLSDEVSAVLKSTVDKLNANGHEVEEVSISELEYSLAIYYIVMPAEVSSNLSRYDGIRYGYSSPDSKNLEQTYELTRSQGFNDEVKRRIMLGTYVLSSGYYDAFYKKAQTARTKLINVFKEKFQQYDVLLSPTSPTTAFKIGQKTNDPLEMYLADVMTVAANLVGIPAISIPAKTKGLPVGIQLMADSGEDSLLLAAAKEVEL